MARISTAIDEALQRYANDPESDAILGVQGGGGTLSAFGSPAGTGR
ncbi:hypothetical protein ACH4MN_36635 [Streptomyces anulatus]